AKAGATFEDLRPHIHEVRAAGAVHLVAGFRAGIEDPARRWTEACGDPLRGLCGDVGIDGEGAAAGRRQGDAEIADRLALSLVARDQLAYPCDIGCNGIAIVGVCAIAEVDRSA